MVDMILKILRVRLQLKIHFTLDLPENIYILLKRGSPIYKTRYVRY